VDFRPIRGATRMLQEGAHQFDIIDSSADLAAYKVVVLPDQIPVSDAFADKLTRYLAQGGALLASFASGMDQARTQFTLDALGVRLTGEGPRDAEGRLVRGREYPGNAYVQYLIPREQLAKGLPRTEHVMYMRGMEVEAAAKSEVLADTVSSYFDRTYKHFCSHRQTPSSGRVVQPGVVQAGRAIYFAHPIFAQYQTKAPRWCRQLFLNALDRLLSEPLVRIEAPTGTLVTLNEQQQEGRWVLHLLYYVPERRCEEFDVIEDIVPLYEVPVSVRVDRAMREVQCVPAGQHLPFDQEAGRVRFTVPVVRGHQMVALSFA
ncbi:MAG TPA: beta-galactosidase trimerization domain-containing protein, partial [Anaerolineae bacterium]|nr:beta-galactosidase trimerization domain-containing protein [Anaerolineae bacterium]